MRRITKIENQKAEIRKKRVAAYCRVSTGSDEQLISLEAQKRHYEDLIPAHPKWEYAGIYYDEGITGTRKDKRSGLMQMIQDCEDGKIDMIITKSISRFARNTTDCLELVRKLSEMGIGIFFERENINTTDMEGELILTILSSLAEEESASISQNAKWSIRKRFENGTYKLSCPPYGYRSVDGKLEIEPEEAEIVRGIFCSYLSGNSTHAIRKELNHRGVPTKRNSRWTLGTINRILRNEKYVGDVMFQKTWTDEKFNRHANHGEVDRVFVRDHHEPIISREDFAAVQDLFDQHLAETGGSKGDAKYQNRYPLTGKLRCGECGTTLKRKKYERYVLWACKRHLEDKNVCAMKAVREDVLQAAFVTMMNKLVFAHKIMLVQLLDSLQRDEHIDGIGSVNRLEQELEENIRQRDRLQQLLAQNLLDEEIFNAENNALLSQYAAEEKTLAELKGRLNYKLQRVEELQKLMRFTGGGRMMAEYNAEEFLAYVDHVEIQSQTRFAFVLKCGLTLIEEV